MARAFMPPSFADGFALEAGYELYLRRYGPVSPGSAVDLPGLPLYFSR